jgi:hypothetical protein
VTLEMHRPFTEQFDFGAGYRYERTSASFDVNVEGRGPVDKNKLWVDGTLAFGEGKPTVSADYAVRLETNDELGIVTRIDSIVALGAEPDTFGTEIVDQYAAVQLDNNVALEVKQRFENGIDYSARYRFLWENDLSDYPDPAFQNWQDTWNHELSARFGFKFKRVFRNRLNALVRFQKEIEDSLDRFVYKVSDNMRIGIVPRRLTLNLKGELGRRLEHQYDAARGADPWFYAQYIFHGEEGEIRFSFTSKLSLSLMGRYEQAYDEKEEGENYNVIIGGLHVTYLF